MLTNQPPVHYIVGSLDIDENTHQSQGSDSGSGNINEDSNFSFVGEIKNTNEDSNDTNMSAGNCSMSGTGFVSYIFLILLRLAKLTRAPYIC